MALAIYLANQGNEVKSMVKYRRRKNKINNEKSVNIYQKQLYLKMFFCTTDYKRELLKVQN